MNCTYLAGKLDGVGEELGARTQNKLVDTIYLVIARDVKVREFIGFEVPIED
jgi:hypothetical protein